jgi:putative thioredoxin
MARCGLSVKSYRADVDVTEETWDDEVIERSRREPVVVDFWAEWCGPCRALGPVLEEATNAAGVTLVKVDTDANQKLALDYGIRGIPAVKAFRNGHVVSEFVGAIPKPRVEEWLAELTKPPLAERVEDPELKAALDAGNYEAAFDLLLERKDREMMVALFAELGQEHPLVTQYRRRLAAALY